jgi:hypothetical protein
MAVVSGPKIVTDGLVLCLDAANPKSYPGSGTSLTDVSGNGNNGNVVSGSNFISEASGSLFRSSDVITLQPISVGLSLSNETYTFFAKCLRDRSSVGGGSFSNWIVHYGTYFGNNSGGFGLQSGGVRYYVKGSTSSGWSSNGSSGTANAIYDSYNWIYYALQIVNNNNIRFFMNNTLIFNVTISDAYTGYGSNSVIFGRNMDMTFSRVAAYNKILSTQEITQNFEATRGRFGI